MSELVARVTMQDRPTVYLSFADERGYYAPFTQEHRSIGAAVNAFMRFACSEYSRYADPHNGVAALLTVGEGDYPDYRLSIGPRGGLHKDRA